MLQISNLVKDNIYKNSKLLKWNLPLAGGMKLNTEVSQYNHIERGAVDCSETTKETGRRAILEDFCIPLPLKLSCGQSKED